MLKRTVILVLSIITLQSCNFHSTGTFKNENIDRRKREEIKALNDKLFQAIENKDLVVINTLLSDTLKKTVNVEQFVSSFITNLSLKNYSILDEYNMISSGEKEGCHYSSDNLGVNDYEIKFIPQTKKFIHLSFFQKKRTMNFWF